MQAASGKVAGSGNGGKIVMREKLTGLTEGCKYTARRDIYNDATQTLRCAVFEARGGLQMLVATIEGESSDVTYAIACQMADAMNREELIEMTQEAIP